MRRLLVFFLLLAAGTLSLEAQDVSTTPIDGPVVRADSLQRKPQLTPPWAGYSLAPGLRMPSLLDAPLNPFEMKEQRAARVAARTYSGVMASVDQNLIWYRTPSFVKEHRMLFFVLRLFLSNPYGFQEGYVPMMNPSFPFISAKTPGMAPFDNPYSPDHIPQCIRSEYDFATGTYKQVMVDWDTYQKNLSMRFSPSTFNTAPIPRTQLTPGDRIVH